MNASTVPVAKRWRLELRLANQAADQRFFSFDNILYSRRNPRNREQRKNLLGQVIARIKHMARASKLAWTLLQGSVCSFKVWDMLNLVDPKSALRSPAFFALVGTLFAALVDAMPLDSDLRQGLPLGRDVFLTYCSGCHGFDGLAFFPSAPSFAMGDRLAKSDPELMNSILWGKGAMPSWEGKLPTSWLEQALAYIRHMDRTGNFSAPENWDGPYYIFAPLGTDPTTTWETR